jgi:hypothetical protein
MPWRQIDAALPGYGLRISHGSVIHLWQTTECPLCAPQPVPPPVKPLVTPWR